MGQNPAAALTHSAVAVTQMGPDPLKSSTGRWAPTEVRGALPRCRNLSKKIVAACDFIERYWWFCGLHNSVVQNSFIGATFGLVPYLQEAKPLMRCAAHCKLVLTKPFYLAPLFCVGHTVEQGTCFRNTLEI